MRFVIIEVERLRELGIDSREFRKNVAGDQAIVHEQFLQPVTDTSALQGYEHDSPQLAELLSSPEWAAIDPATETEVI